MYDGRAVLQAVEDEVGCYKLVRTSSSAEV